jgi:large subunit ribosomal protein L29
MDIEKLRNLTDEELKHQERVAGEQLFRLRFQMKLGQNEGVKKLRDARKDIARIKTIERARQLGLPGETVKAPGETPVKAEKRVTPRKAAAKKRAPKRKTVPKKKLAVRKTAAKKAKPAQKGAR